MNPVLISVAVHEATQCRGFLHGLFWHLHATHGQSAANDAIAHLLTQHGGKRLQVPAVAELVGRNKKRIADYCPKYEDLP